MLFLFRPHFGGIPPQPPANTGQSPGPIVQIHDWIEDYDRLMKPKRKLTKKQKEALMLKRAREERDVEEFIRFLMEVEDE